MLYESVFGGWRQETNEIVNGEHSSAETLGNEQLS